jgi:DNA-binding response OmpR family regulator
MSSEAVPAATDAVVCGPVWLSPDEMCELRLRGKPVRLPVSSLYVLAYLIRAEGRIVSREDLQRETPGRRIAGGLRAVDIRIFRIRRALGSLARYLVAVPGRGYRIDVVGLARAR